MQRIVVLGSLMQDLVVRTPRLPREGETIFGHTFETFVGGKGGNQAIAAARLGAQVILIGRVGADPSGEAILDALRDSGVNTTHIVRDEEIGTGVAIPIVLDNGANSIISVPRANFAMTATQVEAARPEIERASMLMLQFEVSWEATVAAAAMARAAGVPILLNAAPASDPPGGLVREASWLVVNEAEADAFVEFAGDRLRQAAALRALGPATVTITLGGHGSVTVTDDRAFTTLAHSLDAVDTVGAGDAFCGALAVATSEGQGVERAIQMATAAGALAVMRAGAAASLPTRGEVDRVIREGTISLP